MTPRVSNDEVIPFACAIPHYRYFKTKVKRRKVDIHRKCARKKEIGNNKSAERVLDYSIKQATSLFTIIYLLVLFIILLQRQLFRIKVCRKKGTKEKKCTRSSNVQFLRAASRCVSIIYI